MLGSRFLRRQIFVLTRSSSINRRVGDTRKYPKACVEGCMSFTSRRTCLRTLKVPIFVISLYIFSALLTKLHTTTTSLEKVHHRLLPREFASKHVAQAERCSEVAIRDNALQLSNETTFCPTELWYWDWIMRLNVKEFVSVEIGCNKATDAVLNLRAFTGNAKVDIDTWQATSKLDNFACPIDRERWKALQQSTERRAKIYTHHCVEASRENAIPVSEAAKKLGYHEMGLLVYHMAVSSSSMPRTAKFPVIPAGAEYIGIGTDNGQFAEFYNVKIITVDELVVQNNIKQMDVLKIDTEGNDPMVIIGALNSLAHLKPRYLQFENHGVGRWATFQLKDVIDMLDTLSYECFWATNSGKLIRITMCWSDEYSKIKTWSNVACHHRDDKTLSAIMRSYTWSKESRFVET